MEKNIVQIDKDYLDEIIAETNRLSTVLQVISDRQKRINDSFDFVEKLEELSKIDIDIISKKLDKSLETLDFDKLLDKKLDAIVNMYKDDISLNRDLLFEASSKNKTQNTGGFMKQIFLGISANLLAFALAGGVYYYYNDVYKIQQKINNTYLIKKFSQLHNLSTDKYFTIKKELTITNGYFQNQYFYFENNKTKYKVLKMQVKKKGK